MRSRGWGPYRETAESLLSLSLPHEDTARRQLSAMQEESPQQKQFCSDLQPPDCEETTVCCLSRPVAVSVTAA